MKRVKNSIIVIAMIAAMLMTGCAKEQKENKVLDMENVYQTVIALQEDAGKEAPIMLPESNEEYLEMFYPGFSSIARTQTVAYMAPVTGFATEIILVEVTNEEDVKAMTEIFEARIENGSSDTTYPETAMHWANHGQVHTYGNYVAMIVLPEGYIIPDNVFEMEGLTEAGNE